MKILISGGDGLLGRELKKIDPSIISLSRSEMDVSNYNEIVKQIKINTIINHLFINFLWGMNYVKTSECGRGSSGWPGVRIPVKARPNKFIAEGLSK